jgi:hypothetical protein
LPGYLTLASRDMPVGLNKVRAFAGVIARAWIRISGVCRAASVQLTLYGRKTDDPAGEAFGVGLRDGVRTMRSDDGWYPAGFNI